jgi:ubiquinone/menaquinone biosynthesis C-methylase UbiE
MKKGYLDTSKLIKAGISSGTALEVGQGHGYLGIDWLTKTSNTFLKGLDISADMVGVAQRNAIEFHVDDRAEYFQGDARQIVFDDETFDAVFSNGSLHEWSDPRTVLNEIHRVLKTGGVYYISDLRRDMSLFARVLLQRAIPKESKVFSCHSTLPTRQRK